MSASRPTAIGLPAIGLSLALAAVIWVLLWPLQTFDMHEYLLPWMAHIGAHGPVGAFGHPFSNYTPTYLYLLALASPLAALISDHGVVKLVSLLGTLWLAWSVHHLLRVGGAAAPARAGALILLMPSAIVNAALLGQCDAFWAAACVMAVTCALERRAAAMLVWCGLAFAFKAQAVFLAPFAIMMLIAWRSRWTLWTIPPVVYLAAMAPAWLAGWPAADLLTVYLRQAGTFDQLSMNAPNLWQLVQAAPGLDAAVWPHFAFAMAALGAIGLILAAQRLLRAETPVSRETLLSLALLSSIVLPGLLPRMHDRFFFLADVLALALALLRRDRSAMLIAGAIQLGSVLALLSALSSNPAFAAIGAVTMIAATAALAAELFARPLAGRRAAAAT